MLTRSLFSRRPMPLSSSSSCKLSSKVAVREVVKQIHPDLFASQSEEIQAKNLDCVQTLQDVCGIVDALLRDISDSTLQGIAISSPLRSGYSLKCFTRTNALKGTIVSIKTPQLLTQRAVVSRQQLLPPLTNFLRDFSLFWGKLDVGDPWRDFVESHSTARPRFSAKAESYSNYESLVQTVGRKLFDDSVRQRHGVRSQPNPFQPMRGTGRRGREKHLKLVVDRYLSSGRVLFQDVHVVEEADLLSKLRSFFFDYGDLINFNELNWSNIYLVVIGKPDANYDVEERDSCYIVKLPRNFTTSDVLDVLQNRIPNCKLI